MACPNCGLTDKDGVKNKYSEHSIESYCPNHGLFETDVDKEPHRLEYNTPLRNLVRALVYSEDNNDDSLPFEWLRVTGGDYAGFIKNNCYTVVLQGSVIMHIGYLKLYIRRWLSIGLVQNYQKHYMLKRMLINTYPHILSILENSKRN